MSNLLFSVQGRANRAKFWLVALAIVVIEVILFAVLLGGAAMSGDPEQIAAAMGPVASVVILAFVVIATWMSVAVAVKRYHDRNKSGWWVLIVFVPVIGGLWYLIECGFLRGTAGPNAYGPDPLAAMSSPLSPMPDRISARIGQADAVAAVGHPARATATATASFVEYSKPQLLCEACLQLEYAIPVAHALRANRRRDGVRLLPRQRFQSPASDWLLEPGRHGLD